MRIGIALGSNVGDRQANLDEAVRRLLAMPGLSPPAARSSTWETQPVGCPEGSPPFYNAVIELDWAGDETPEKLLNRLKKIETQMGRDPSAPRNSPRTIDLDILYIDAMTYRSDLLELPHPRIAARRFVLGPLAEIRPGLILPGSHLKVEDLFALAPPDAARSLSRGSSSFGFSGQVGECPR